MSRIAAWCIAAAAALGGHALAGPVGVATAWGENYMPLVPPGTRFKAIAAGDAALLAVRTDGTVLEWGGGDALAGLTGVTGVAASSTHCLALKSDGTVAAGDNTAGESTVPAGLTGVVAIAAAAQHMLPSCVMARWSSGDTWATRPRRG